MTVTAMQMADMKVRAQFTASNLEQQAESPIPASEKQERSMIESSASKIDIGISEGIAPQSLKAYRGC